MIGDGNISTRIRDSKTYLSFIPLLRLTQKNTKLNFDLFNTIILFLDSLKIKSLISDEGRNIVLRIEGKVSIDAFLQLLTQYNDLFFWKANQFSMVSCIIHYLSINSRNWLELQRAIVLAIYKLPGNKEQDINFWFSRVDSIINERFNKTTPFLSAYLSGDTQIGWIVTLPKSLNMKPAQKYFLFDTYGVDGSHASAVQYRDNKLSTWIEDHGTKD